MIAPEDYLNLTANEFAAAAKPSAGASANKQYVDPITVSHKILREAAAEKDRVSEVVDKEKLVSQGGLPQLFQLSSLFSLLLGSGNL